MAQVERIVRTPTILIKVDGQDVPVDHMDDLLDLEMESSLFLPSMVRMTFHDDSIAITDSELFKPGKVLELSAGEVDFSDSTPQAVSIFKGEIVAVEPYFSVDGKMELTIRAYDKRHRLNTARATKTYLNLTHSDIIQQICGAAGISCEVTSTNSVYPYTIQHNVTDLEFIYQLAYRNSLEVAMEGDSLKIRKAKSSADMSLEWGTSLASFRPNLSTSRQVSKVIVKGWDNQEKKAITGEASSSKSQPSTSIGTATATSQQVFGQAEYVEVEYPILNQADANKLAQAILDEIGSKFIQAEGTAYGNPQIVAGAIVDISNIGNKFSGKYHVTSALHRYSKDGYEVDFRVEGNYPLPVSGGSGVSFFGDGFAGQARYHGVYIGLVTNNEDPDNLSRVKVKLPWLSDRDESNWARIVMPGAGKERGLYVMPEIDDEVLVAFEQGDPNRPVIIGNMWNSKDKTPLGQATAVASGKVKTRIFQTRGGHYLKFVEDSDGYIELQDAGGNTQLKLDYISKEITLKSTGKVNVEGSQDVTVKAATKVVVDGSSSVEISSNGNIKVAATGNLELSASGMVTIRGTTVNIN